MSERSKPDYYAVENTVRIGRFPGEIVSTHASHWAAVAETIRLSGAAAAGTQQQPSQ